MLRRLHRAALGAGSLLLAGSAAAGAQTIEVPPVFPDIQGCGHLMSSAAYFFCGQTFTAPLGAATLDSFGFILATQDVLSFELYAFSSPNVTGSALFTQVFGPTSSFEALTFTPAGGIPVTGGAMYVALVRMEPEERINFRLAETGTYDGGSVASCVADPLPGACNLSGVDFAFTAVFSPAMTPVPEPATLALTGAGLLLLGGLARRRRA